MENVIRAEERFKRTAPPAKTLDAKLRALVQVPLADRAILAEGFGALAAQLAPENPLLGAKQMFGAAWGGNKWDKRKRLVRLPGEPASDTSEYGAYEASGPTWASLASACSHLISGSASPLERERLLRKLLRGTSLLPAAATPAYDANGARALFGEIADRIVRRIRDDTNIAELWDVLQSTPFWVDELRGDQTGSPLDACAADATGIMAPRLGAFQSYVFTSHPLNLGRNFRWSYPIVRLGAFAERVSGYVFVVPGGVAEAFVDLSDERNVGMVERWIDDLGDDFLTALYDEKTGYGWMEREFERTKTAYLQLCPRGADDVALWLNVQESFIDNFVPVIPGRDITRMALEFSDRIEDVEPFTPDEWDPPRSHALIEWPRWMEGVCAEVSEGRLVGLVDTDELIGEDAAGNPRMPRSTAEPDGMLEKLHGCSPRYDEYLPEGIGGWLDDEENQDVGDLLLSQRNGRFISLLAGEQSSVLPCHPDSLGAAILANAHAAEDLRISTIFCEQARDIARAGLQYFDGVMEHSRSLIDRF